MVALNYKVSNGVRKIRKSGNQEIRRLGNFAYRPIRDWEKRFLDGRGFLDSFIVAAFGGGFLTFEGEMM